MIPPYNPLEDSSLSWAVARVTGVATARGRLSRLAEVARRLARRPTTPTWTTPARVTFEIVEVLRGQLPPRVEVEFGPPREAGQAYLLARRGLFPPQSDAAAAELQRRTVALDATPIEVPALRSVVIVWLVPSEAGWEVPPRLIYHRAELPMRSRWVEASPEALAFLRARLGATRAS
jgi:hypothetical protein